MLFPSAIVFPTDLRVEIRHRGGFNILLSQYFHLNGSRGELGGEVIQEVGQVAGLSVDDPHDVVSRLQNMSGCTLGEFEITNLQACVDQSAVSAFTPATSPR